MQHTKGPWGCDEATGIVYTLDGSAVQTGGAGCAEEFQANARLIAAAPELLASLKEVLADASWELERPIIKRAEAIIAKCEGK